MKTNLETCGCCEGIEVVTPQPTANRPGLSKLTYRVGTHATFFETLLARLSSGDYPVLNELTTRDQDDPSIAVLDAWATVADVLTFYNERIINENYLRTATERRSILELARLVGYKLRPGVASSVYLAYTVDNNFKDEVTIPKGARAQSLPGPGEFPQSFETSEDLKARAKWNNLQPRTARPQTQESIQAGDGVNQRLYLKGISTNLKPNDPLLIDFFGDDNPIFERIKEVKLEPEANRTLIVLQSQSQSSISQANMMVLQEESTLGLLDKLTQPPSMQPPNSLRFSRDAREEFIGNKASLSIKNTTEGISLSADLVAGEASHSTIKTFAPVLNTTLATAAENARVTKSNPLKVFALRGKASLFGYNHPGLSVSVSRSVAAASDMLKTLAASAIQGNSLFYYPIPILGYWPDELVQIDQKSALSKIALEPQNEQLQMDSWLVLERPDLTTSREKECKDKGRMHSIHKIKDVQNKTMLSRQTGNISLGYSNKVNVLEIEKPWLDGESKIDELLNCMALLKETTAYTQSEELVLAEEPIDETVCGSMEQLLELDGFYEGLESGRWVVVSGERELAGTSGVKFNELAMIAGVSQNTRNTYAAELQGDSLHTFIKLANKLEYCFKRDTVTIHGNVVKATHGETRKEVLGSGDGAKALQSFALKQSPLTYVSSSNVSGVDSTLMVAVNDIKWHEAETFVGLGSTDRNFITKTDDDGKTTVAFGNGREGLLLPTGLENIKAEYRNGIGKPGNVNAGQITLLTTKPLGVKEVVNPLRASGGADKENRDHARKNVPLAIKALDRLVSVQDYEDFARTYAGVGKAKATEISDCRRQLVHVTIAGADDIPIDKNTDLYRNLKQALQDSGDPYQAIQLEVRELMLIVIQANIRILPDYFWEPVVTQVRVALLDAFSFERRELGQDVLLSEVLSVAQAVPGVAYVDVDLLRGIPEKVVDSLHPGQRRLITPGEIADIVSLPFTEKDGQQPIKEPVPRILVNLAGYEDGAIRPAQLAFLTPDVPATLVLNQIN
jgi:Baseplate J-like protein